MLEVVEINYIRHEVNQKGKAYEEVARQVQHDPRTVKKYANQEEFPQKQKQKRKSPVMDRVKPIIDGWIREDLKMKKKYQRTAQRMFDQLVQEHDFEGKARTVRDYVSKRKRELTAEAEGATLPLETIPGTAQVDFGKAPFKYLNEIIELPFLVMSFPHANTFYFQVFPSENTECLLEGLQRMFQHMGSVPKTIRFDNLSPAVKKILAKGERELTDMFERFVLHYGFDYEFCNPAKGNEKGHVENMVKYVRNNFLLPAQTITDLEDFNQTLWSLAEENRHRVHYEKEIALTVLHEETCAAHILLPEKLFHCARMIQVKADKSGLIHLETKVYSTSPRFAQKKVLVQITYNEVQIIDENQQVIATHPRLYGSVAKSMVWQPYLKLLSQRPRAIKYSGVYDHLPEEWQTYLKACTEEEQKEGFALLADLMKAANFEQLTQALTIASKTGHPKAEYIQQAFNSLVFDGAAHQPITPAVELPTLPNIERSISRYDALFKEVTSS